MYQYSEAELKQEIAEYIRNGCYPFCRRSAFADKVEMLLADDIAELKRINKAYKRPFLCVDYDKIVSRRYSGLNRRYYNSRLIREAFKVWGARSLAYLREAGVLLPKDKSVRGRGMYIQNMEMLGKEICGCYVGSFHGASALFYYAAKSPVSSVMNFYHEAGHNLQNLLGMKSWKGQDDYMQYKCEVHAEAFASAMMILRAKTEQERRQAEAFVMKKAMNSAEFGENFDVRYNSYAVIKQLVPALRKLDRRMLERADGRIDMIKTARLAQRVVDKYAYLRLDFENYSVFREQNKDLYRFKPEQTRWYKDCMEARENRKFDRMAELENVYVGLQKARSEQEKAAVFQEEYLFCGEDVRAFRQLYFRHNRRGRYYEMLKRTEAVLKPKNLWKKVKQRVCGMCRGSLCGGRDR
ncbi:MAG: hypothetical protein SO314_08545 [Alphaproteobacteria bacterium]|nr:hypothetical protein [Alphaproteobacteria bacterium]